MNFNGPALGERGRRDMHQEIEGIYFSSSANCLETMTGKFCWRKKRGYEAQTIKWLQTCNTSTVPVRCLIKSKTKL